MNLTEQPTSTSAAPTYGATTLWRSAALTALVAVVLVIGLIGGGAPAAASDGSAADLPVGHSVKHIVETGAQIDRKVDVHLWYPRRPAGRLRSAQEHLYVRAVGQGAPRRVGSAVLALRGPDRA
jgi:hypothetical protein